MVLIFFTIILAVYCIVFPQAIPIVVGAILWCAALMLYKYYKNKNKKMEVKVSWIGLLGVAFVVLKLCNVIAWSWWFVLMPFYLPIAIGFILVFGIIFAAFTSFAIDIVRKYSDDKDEKESENKDSSTKD